MESETPDQIRARLAVVHARFTRFYDDEQMGVVMHPEGPMLSPDARDVMCEDVPWMLAQLDKRDVESEPLRSCSGEAPAEGHGRSGGSRRPSLE
jgi:hypothetical protein